MMKNNDRSIKFVIALFSGTLKKKKKKKQKKQQKKKKKQKKTKRK